MMDDQSPPRSNPLQATIFLQIMDDLRQKPTCQRILAVMEKQVDLMMSNIGDITQMFLEHPEQIKRLVMVALTPEKIGCRSASWSCLAADLLRKEPPNLLLTQLEPPGAKGHILFEWMAASNNPTAFGYFAKIMNCYSNDFQDKLLTFLVAEEEMMQTCLDCCEHMQVFMVLYNSLLESAEYQREHQQRLLGVLFELLFREKGRTQLAENLLQVMKSINETVDKLPQWLCATIVNILNQDYVARILKAVSALAATQEQCCENLLRLLNEFVKLYDRITQLNKESETIPLGSLERAVTTLIKSMSVLTDILGLQSKTEISFSNGQNVSAIGLMRFYCLELISSLLKLPSNLVSANFDVNKGRILYLLEVRRWAMQNYISKNPWNNMVHLLVESIIVNIVNSFESYVESEDTYIGKNGFLGFLIETFKNHDYMFLNRYEWKPLSCKLSTYGYIHYLYNIATAICSKLQKSKDLQTIMEKFEPWARFVVDDLQEYEKNIDSELGESVETVTAKKLVGQQSIRKIVIDMNQKQASVVAEKEDQQPEMHDLFYEVIKKSAFKQGHITLTRKNSVDSPTRKRSGSDSLKNEKHGVLNLEKPRASVFNSHNPSPQRLQYWGQEISPLSDSKEEGAMRITLHPADCLEGDDKGNQQTPSEQTIPPRIIHPMIKVSELQVDTKGKGDYRSRSECKPSSRDQQQQPEV